MSQHQRANSLGNSYKSKWSVNTHRAIWCSITMSGTVRIASSNSRRLEQLRPIGRRARLQSKTAKGSVISSLSVCAILQGIPSRFLIAGRNVSCLGGIIDDGLAAGVEHLRKSFRHVAN